MATNIGQGGVTLSTDAKRFLNVSVYRLASTAPDGSIAAPADFTDLQNSPQIGQRASIAPGYTSIAFSFLRETANYDGTQGDTPNGLRIGCMEYRPGVGPVYPTVLPTLKAANGDCYGMEINAEVFGDIDNPAFVEIIVERPIA